MNRSRIFPGLGVLLACALSTIPASAETAPSGLGPVHVGAKDHRIPPPQPVLAGRTARPMRYQPQDGGFAITIGRERFNRPLYIGHDGARFDAGDGPEFAFYLPGKGGVLRLGIIGKGGAKWLHLADEVKAVYREGRMDYQIMDALLGEARVEVVAVPADRPGAAILKVLSDRDVDGELLVAFGGATGVQDFRGDIGYTDIVRHYDLRAADCKGAAFEIEDTRFVLRREAAVVSGLSSIGLAARTADAAQWNSPARLLDAGDGGQPVLVGKVRLAAGQAVFLMLARGEVAAMSTLEMAELHERSVRTEQKVANQVSVKTPDPFVNALVPAINIAADGLWDGQNRFAHGNVAWRRSYFGWRPAYAGDALGWHERTRTHTRFCFSKQMVHQGPGEPDMAFKSDGYFLEDYGRIYNWNPKAMDVLMRHLAWTGDLDFAREAWPFLKRHLAREKRLFDRDGLYDSVIAIWASDALSYNAGGVTHSSAFNLHQNRMAAEIARKIGEDPQPYEAEARRIADAMQQRLWLPERGSYAEYRDTWGGKQAHPAAALCTAYHAIDCGAPDAFQAWQVARAIETDLPRIPVHGPGVPQGDWFLTPTTTWMPYTWSINNVAVGEMSHAALACWQAGRADQAWKLFMGTTLDSMFRGTCPGNVGMTLAFDAFSGEKIRDFGFIGIMSRALTEGLFGVRPDLLNGDVTLRPGWPQDWQHASFTHPSISYHFERKAQIDIYQIEPRFGKPAVVKLEIPARGSGVKATLNGQPVEVANVADSIGQPFARVVVPAGTARVEISLEWTGDAPSQPGDLTRPPTVPATPPLHVVAAGGHYAVGSGKAEIIEIKDPQDALKDVDLTGHSLVAKATERSGPRVVFLKVKEGAWEWWMPLTFEVRPALEVLTDYDGRETPRLDDGSLRFRLRNNSAGRLMTDAVVSVGPWRQTIGIDIPGRGGMSEEISVVPENRLPGNQPVVIEAAGRSAVGMVANWAPSSTGGFRSIPMAEVFNSRVSEIFADGKYRNRDFPPVKMVKFDLVPTEENSPGITLAIPDSGLGDWVHSNAWQEYQRIGGINDQGLRTKAAANGGMFRLESGVPFEIPTAADAKNIVFTTHWDAYPAEVIVPLNGKARHAYLLMAGSTYHMQSRHENGRLIITYADGGVEELSLRNPENWWPIHCDYFVDDFAFQIRAPRPPRIRLLDGAEHHGTRSEPNAPPHTIGRNIPGGAATVLDLPLDPQRELKSLTVRTTTNEVVIGLMAVTLAD